MVGEKSVKYRTVIYEFKKQSREKTHFPKWKLVSTKDLTKKQKLLLPPPYPLSEFILFEVLQR